MTKTEPRDEPRRYTPTDVFTQACEIAGLAVPSTPRQVSQFVERCVKGAKHKAELFAKAHFVEMTHSEALERVAMLFGFADWHGLSSAGKAFEASGGLVGPSDLRPLRLAACAWVLVESTGQQPVAKGVLMAQRAFLEENDLPGAAEGLIERVMFRRATAESTKRRSRSDPWTVHEVDEILTRHMAWTPAELVMRLLEYVPVVDGKRARYPALDGLTVGDLYEMPLAQYQHEHGFGYRGWSHLMALLSTSMEQWAEVHSSYGPLSPREKIEQEREELLRQCNAAATKLACKEYLEHVLHPVFRKKVLDVVMRSPGNDGFYEQELYSGPVEQVEAEIREIMHIDGDDTRFKRVCFRERHGEFYLTIFRLSRKPPESPAGAMVHEAEAVFHDGKGLLAARVGMCLSLQGGGESLEDLLWQLDSANESDLLEVAGAVVAAVEDGRLVDEEWRRLLVVRDWEVRAELRGQGIGLELLGAALKRGFRGLPRPLCVAARVWPKQIAGTPYHDGPAIGMPELAQPIRSLRAYWQSKVVGSAGLLPRVVSIDVPYMPVFHYGLADFEQLGIALLRQRVLEFKGG